MGLFEGLSRHSSSVALIDTALGEWSYQQLETAADTVAGGIERRSLIFCLCTNHVESVIGYVGFQRSHHVCLMLPSSVDEERLEQLSTQFRPNFVWAPRERVMRQAINTVHEGSEYRLTRVGTTTVEMHDDLALLMGTSGSTGSPMMVRQSHVNLAANANAIAHSLDLVESDRAITTLPMNYTYGLSIINSQLCVGGSVVLCDATLMDRKFWDDLSISRATYFGGVPYTYQMLSRLGIKRLKGTNLRMMTQAGGKLSADLVSKVHSEATTLGIKFHVMYGQTEATARMSVLSSDDVPTHEDSIGRPIPGGRFRILDLESDVELAEGETGELEYSGANVTLGYASSADELDRADDFNGRLRTGDLARVDSDGFFYVVGRRKRFIKLFGNRVSLDHVEAHLQSKGLTAACSGTDDLLQAFVEGVCDVTDVTNQLASFVGVHPSGVKVTIIAELPRAESGKVLYSQLEKSSHNEST